MINRFYILGFLAISVGLVSCDKDNTLNIANGNEMVFKIYHPYDSATTRATDTAFENNDKVGVIITESGTPLQVSGNYVNNSSLTFDGSVWNSTRTIYWNDGTYDVYGYYPFINKISSVGELPFAVNLDQKTGRGYTDSDFMYGISKGVAASSSAVSLHFKHIMSKIRLTLVKADGYEGDLPNEARVFIHNTIPNATIDLAAGVATKDSHYNAASIEAKSIGNYQYEAIIVPQRVDYRVPLVEVVTGGVSYMYETRFVFKPGIQHSVNMAISNDPAKVLIDISGELVNW